MNKDELKVVKEQLESSEQPNEQLMGEYYGFLNEITKSSLNLCYINSEELKRRRIDSYEYII